MVYKITTYDLIGKILHTYKEMDFLEYRDEKTGSKRGYYVKGTRNEEYQTGRRYTLSTNIPQNSFIEDENEKFLPYFADVTQDLPTNVKFEPKTWKRCQLLRETHGGYLQFYHESTQETLRIAMNSNYYVPVN